MPETRILDTAKAAYRAASEGVAFERLGIGPDAGEYAFLRYALRDRGLSITVREREYPVPEAAEWLELVLSFTADSMIGFADSKFVESQQDFADLVAFSLGKCTRRATIFRVKADVQGNPGKSDEIVTVRYWLLCLDRSQRTTTGL